MAHNKTHQCKLYHCVALQGMVALAQASTVAISLTKVCSMVWLSKRQNDIINQGWGKCPGSTTWSSYNVLKNCYLISLKCYVVKFDSRGRGGHGPRPGVHFAHYAWTHIKQSSFHCSCVSATILHAWLCIAFSMGETHSVNTLYQLPCGLPHWFDLVAIQPVKFLPAPLNSACLPPGSRSAPKVNL